MLGLNNILHDILKMDRDSFIERYLKTPQTAFTLAFFDNECDETPFDRMETNDLDLMVTFASLLKEPFGGLYFQDLHVLLTSVGINDMQTLRTLRVENIFDLLCQDLFESYIKATLANRQDDIYACANCAERLVELLSGHPHLNHLLHITIDEVKASNCIHPLWILVDQADHSRCYDILQRLILIEIPQDVREYIADRLGHAIVGEIMQIMCGYEHYGLSMTHSAFRSDVIYMRFVFTADNGSPLIALCELNIENGIVGSVKLDSHLDPEDETNALRQAEGILHTALLKLVRKFSLDITFLEKRDFPRERANK